MSRYSLFLVIAQFFLIGFLVLSTTIFTTIPALIIQVIGLSIALWGVLTIRIGNFNIQPEVKSKTLITSGPFRWVRNPMYLGILMVFLPAVIHRAGVLNWSAYTLLVIILFLKIYREEKLLVSHFSEEYLTYMATSKRLIPYLY